MAREFREGSEAGAKLLVVTISMGVNQCWTRRAKASVPASKKQLEQSLVAPVRRNSYAPGWRSLLKMRSKLIEGTFHNNGKPWRGRPVRPCSMRAALPPDKTLGPKDGRSSSWLWPPSSYLHLADRPQIWCEGSHLSRGPEAPCIWN